MPPATSGSWTASISSIARALSKYVITIEALKEGWDCSFAYVFCSVARIRSAVDVEQLLGRVLRMLYATRRRVSNLNKAYAFVSEPAFGASAQALADKLVAMGFEEDEARDHIEPVQQELDGSDDLFAPYHEAPPAFRHVVAASPELASRLKEIERDGVTVHETDAGTIEIAIDGRLDNATEEAILEALPESEWQGFSTAVRKHRLGVREQLCPAEQGEEFKVPRLMSAVQGDLEFADTDLFMEDHDWSLLDHSPRLDEDEFAIRETARSFEINLDGHRITYRFASEAEQLALNVDVEGWTPEALVLWLDRQVRQPDIRQNELIRWLQDLASHLIDARGLHISALMRGKFLLARKIRDKIEGHPPDGARDRLPALPLRPGGQGRGLVRPRFHLPDTTCTAISAVIGVAGNRESTFWGPTACRPSTAWRTARRFRCAQAIDSLPGLRVLDSQRGARSGFVLAAHRDRAVLPGLRGTAPRRTPSRRRVQGRTPHRRAGNAREASHRCAVGAQER